MRVMVTGASGDFGACIVPEILSRGHEVVGLSRRPHTMRSLRYIHVAADVRDSDAVAKAMVGVDAVVHLDPKTAHEARVQGIGLRAPNTVPVIFDRGKR
jgi:nucleoside-diphosphate-sugar epimerase